MLVRQTPLPRRPASAGGRPGSAKARAIREQVKKAQLKNATWGSKSSEDIGVAVGHRSTSPAPDASNGICGPGQFRNFGQDSKFSLKDSNNGDTAFALGPKADHGDMGKFRTLDISRINAERHNWQRIDTFQTPAGHLGGYRLIEELQAYESNGSLERLLEVVRKEIREGVREELQASVALIRDDIAKAVSQIVGDVKHSFDAELSAREEAFQRQIGRLRNEIDFSPVLQRIEEKSVKMDFAQLLEQYHLTKSAVLKSLWECKNAVDISQLAENVVNEVRKTRIGVDFQDVMEGISKVDTKAGSAFKELMAEIQIVKIHIDALDYKIDTLDNNSKISATPRGVKEVVHDDDISAVRGQVSEVLQGTSSTTKALLVASDSIKQTDMLRVQGFSRNAADRETSHRDT